MNKVIALVLSSSFLIAGCASAGSHDKDMKKAEMKAEMKAGNPAIMQAEADLKAANKAGGAWRVIDKATGGKAQDLKKLLKVAKEKAKAGETDEANRIAAHVSKAAKLGVAQAERYKGALPYYN